MDAMSLLCTLHADGPATLKRLRSAGCSTLEGVETLDQLRLVEILGGPPAAARRFAREARSLRERLDSGLLEREEAAPSTLQPPEPAVAVAVDPGPGPEEPVPADSDAAEPERRIEERLSHEVLEAWRTRDQSESHPDEDGLPHPEIEDGIPPRTWRARAEFEFGLALASATRSLYEGWGAGVEEECPARAGNEGSLRPGAIDGLDDALVVALAAAGVDSLPGLGRADALALSVATGIEYTRLWRLVMLARRAKEPAFPPPSEAPEAAASWGPPRIRFSPAEVPAEAHGQESRVVEIVPAPPRERHRTVFPVPDPAESPGGPFA